MATQVDFGGWINKSLDLYKKHFGILVLSGLVAGLIAIVTGGILSGPMLAGIYLVVLALMDGKEPKPTVGTVFDGFQHFLQMLLFSIVWGIILIVANSALSAIVCVGSIAAMAGSLVLGALLMFAPFLIIEKGMEFWPASMKSIEMGKPVLWPLVGYYCVSSIFGSLGAIACGIGAIFTMPIMFCMIAVAYREMIADAPEGDAPAEEAPAAVEAPAEDAAAEAPAEEAAPAEPESTDAPAEGDDSEEKSE